GRCCRSSWFRPQRARRLCRVAACTTATTTMSPTNRRGTALSRGATVRPSMVSSRCSTTTNFSSALTACGPSGRARRGSNAVRSERRSARHLYRCGTMNAVVELRSLLEDLETNGTTVIDMVQDAQPLVPWRLYPGDSGIFDRRTRYQFYFHTHAADNEAGHFHTVRLFPDHTAHLIAISIAADG